MSKGENKYKAWPMAKRLTREHLRPYFGKMGLAILFLVLLAVLTTVQPVILQITFDKLFKQKNVEYLNIIPIAIFSVFFLQAIATFLSNYIMAYVGQNFAAGMQIKLFKHSIEYDVSFHSDNSSGDLIQRITRDISYIWVAVNVIFVGVFKQIITTVGLLGVMFYQSAELTLIITATFALAVYPIIRITVRLKKLSKQTMEKSGDLTSRLFESFTGIGIIKAYGKENSESTKAGEYITELKIIALKALKVRMISSPMMLALAGLAVAFVIWHGGSQLLEGKMTEGNLIAFITSLLMLSRPIKSLSSINSILQNAIVAMERYYKIIDEEPAQESRTDGKKLKVTSGKINFEDVDFGYNEEKTILKNFNLAIPHGKKIAIVGHSGSGKTTLFNLLLKFYLPQSGAIKIDGQDIKETSAESLRENIAIVSQDSFIFDDTVANNIAIGKENASESEIKKAAEAANCTEFIEQLPEGIQTKLGYFGQSLSGGQKQRLSIARAFLRNAPILLLDEATSALDPESEAKIKSSIDALSKGKTTLMIAHRLSTVMSADLIVMIEDGEVIGTGTHDELLKKSDRYSDMFGL